MASKPKKRSSYDELINRRIIWMAAMGALLSASIIGDILTGPARLSVSEVLTALFSPSSAGGPTNVVIVHSIRLPMTLMAMIVGASLGVAGVQMQTILNNPLASPFTLGFSAAAGFGAAITILFGWQLPLIPELTVPLAAFLAAGVSCAVVYGLARLRGVTAEIMILAGIAALFLFQSLQSLIQYLAVPEVLQEIVFWLFGSMLKANWFTVSASGLIFLSAVSFLIGDVWKLTALRLGDDRARSLGVDVSRLRRKIFIVVSLLTAGAVAFVGTIGFVGLVAPHIARMVVGEDQRILIPASGIMGAIIMVCASIASKLLSPGAVVPIGIVTAIFGVPFLFILILNGKKRHW